MVLSFASDELRGDEEIVFAAVIKFFEIKSNISDGIYTCYKSVL